MLWYLLGSMLGVVVGFVALLIALTALVVSLYTYANPDRGVKVAFKRLEGEVDDQWAKVESHLGRISRLKRDGGNVASATEEPKQLRMFPPSATVFNRPISTRSQLLAQALRRNNAKSSSSGSDER